MRNDPRQLVYESEFLVEFTGGAGDKYPSTDAALAVFHPLHDAGRLATFGTIRALGCVHDLCAVSSFGDLCHFESITP
jgi:hypothetical protein